MTGRFTTALVVCQVGDQRWRLAEPLVYESCTYCIAVPSGFETDFASIPRVFWTLFPESGEYDAAAVVHDYLYVKGGAIPGKGHVFTKAEADDIFRDAMEALGVPAWKRSVMYYAVRAFGKGNFEN